MSGANEKARLLTLAAYERSGGVRGAVGRHADAAFRSLREDERQVARRILLRLVTGGGGEALTRRRVSRAELDADSDEQVARVLATLVERRLLVADDGSVELVHEALLEQWPRLKEWLEEDAQGRRLHLHLAQAASEWEASGREPGELYRGARLAAALEWADATGEQAAGLNRLEREFLEESRTAFARANRRLRALLAAAVVLLLAALVAGGVALAARGSAKRQATAAIAQRLGAQALSEQRLDRALLLARAGIALDDTEATRSDLLATLLRSPTALRVLHPGGSRVLDDALSPDGRVLAVRGDDGSVAFFDTRSLRTLVPRFHGPGGIGDLGSNTYSSKAYTRIAPEVADAARAVEARTQGAKRMRVEERDAAVVAADCENAAIRAERVVEDARAAAHGGPRARPGFAAAARAGCCASLRVVERDPFTCEEQRPVESRLRQRLRAQSLRDRRRRLPLRATACRERDATGDQRRQQQDDSSREQRAQPPRRARVRRCGSPRGTRARGGSARRSLASASAQSTPPRGARRDKARSTPTRRLPLRGRLVSCPCSRRPARPPRATPTSLGHCSSSASCTSSTVPSSATTRRRSTRIAGRERRCSSLGVELRARPPARERLAALRR